MRNDPLIEGHRAATYASVFAQRQNDWGILDSYYIPTRYPNGLPDDIPARVYNELSATEALTLTEEVVAEIESWFADQESSQV